MVMATRTPSEAEMRRRAAAARQRVEQMVRLLHRSVDAIATPADFGAALASTGRLRRVTFSNAILATAQRPDVTDLDSYDGWLARGRQVLKGEHGIRQLTANVAPAAGLVDPDGPRKIENLATTVVFDVTQTQGQTQQEVEAPPSTAVYSETEVARALAAADPAERDGADPAGLTAAEAIRRAAWRSAVAHAGPADAQQVGACAEYLLRAGCGLRTDADALGFISDWDRLPASARRRQLIDVVNRARQAAGTLIDLVHAGGPAAAHLEKNTVTKAPGTVVAAASSAEQPQRQASAALADAPAFRSGPAVGPTTVSARGAADPGTLAAASAAAWQYFRDCAGNDPAAVGYLAQRGIAPCPGLPVGYAPPDVRLGAHLRSLGYPDEVQVAAGLARRLESGRVVDVFRDRVVAAFVDGQGRIAGFTARALHDSGPKYLNTKATALFTKSSLLYGLTLEVRGELEAGATPVLCEGLMDVLAIAQHRPSGLVPVATCGTAFTPVHAADLMEMMPRTRIVVAYDGDPAGVTAAIRVGQMLSQDGWGVHTPMPAGGLDPAEVAAERGAPVVEWVSWQRSRPAIYLAAEHLLAATEHDGSPLGRQSAGAGVIDILQRDWGTDDALPDAIDYVGMQTGLRRADRAVPNLLGRPNRAATPQLSAAAGSAGVGGLSASRTATEQRPTTIGGGGAVAYSDRRLRPVASICGEAPGQTR